VRRVHDYRRGAVQVRHAQARLARGGVSVDRALPAAFAAPQAEIAVRVTTVS